MASLVLVCGRGGELFLTNANKYYTVLYTIYTCLVILEAFQTQIQLLFIGNGLRQNNNRLVVTKSTYKKLK